jgi:signal transduction histidine kinase
VRDTGEGIPAEELPRIWERFYRGENARADDVRGAGLGLALVKERAEAMGGSVEVESTVGEGSRFVVGLPISDA